MTGLAESHSRARRLTQRETCESCASSRDRCVWLIAGVLVECDESLGNRRLLEVRPQLAPVGVFARGENLAEGIAERLGCVDTYPRLAHTSKEFGYIANVGANDGEVAHHGLLHGIGRALHT